MNAVVNSNEWEGCWRDAAWDGESPFVLLKQTGEENFNHIDCVINKL